MDTIRVYATISGRVQGVAYRWHTQEAASDLGVRGWVRNLPNGCVELVAEGSRDKVDELLGWCRQGPSLAIVEDVQTRYEPATGEFSSFSIRH